MEADDPRLPGMPESLAPLAQLFLESPFRAAPERSEELRKLIEQHGISLRLKPDCKDWLFEEFRMGRFIYTNGRTIERLWAYAYGFVAIISEMQACQGEWRGMSEEYHLGLRLILWANHSTSEDRELAWPDGLPKPSSLEVKYVDQANEVFLMLSARLLLHEIGHYVLGHSGELGRSNDELKKEEHDADEWADEWILSKWSEFSKDQRVFLQRALGVAASYAPLLMLSAEGSDDGSHPSPMERVIEFATRYFPTSNPTAKNSNDFPVAFLFAMIVAATTIRGKGVVQIDEFPATYVELFEGLRKCLDASD